MTRIDAIHLLSISIWKSVGSFKHNELTYDFNQELLTDGRGISYHPNHAPAALIIEFAGALLAKGRPGQDKSGSSLYR